MSDSFNGYHVWLGIPPNEQPPNHYRLLGIAAFETDLDVIDHAADRQMAHVRTFQSGRNGGLSQQILNQLAAARVCLLNTQRKKAYDEQLRAKLASGVAAVPVGKAVPVAQPAAAAVIPRAEPAASIAEPAAKPLDDDEIEVDVSPAPLARAVLEDDELAPGSSQFSSPAIEIRPVPKRPINRDASLQRALVYLFMGVAILVVVMVLYGMVSNMVSGTDWKNWFSVPAVNAPAEPGMHDESEPAPAAPEPAPPGSEPAPAAPEPAPTGTEPDPTS